MKHTEEATDEPTLTFWGAASAVTGSMHLFTVGRRKILLDCGLYQGSAKRRAAATATSPPPGSDRFGDRQPCPHRSLRHLPTLVQQGYDGPIYCTPPTRDLLK